MRLVVVALAVLLLAGCGGDDPPPPPATFPVAFSVAEDELPDLLEAEDPVGWLREHGRVVARSRFSSATAVVAAQLLSDRERIDLLSSRYDALAGRISQRTQTTLLFLTAAQERRDGERLADVTFTEPELRAFHERFTQESDPDAGRAMADMIEVLRRGLAAAGDGRVGVVGPLD